MNDDILSAKTNNFLWLSILDESDWVYSFVDISTGGIFNVGSNEEQIDKLLQNFLTQRGIGIQSQ